MINRDMSEAPRDRNILILTEVLHYRDEELYSSKSIWQRKPSGYHPVGQKWVEARWRDGDEKAGRPAGFALWCGTPRTHSTEGLRPLAWAELPSDASSAESWNENLGSLSDDPRKPLLLSLEESGWICHRLMQDLASPVKPSNSVFAEAIESVRQRMLHLYGRVSALNDDLMGKKND